MTAKRTTLGDVLEESVQALRKAGLEEARLDARLIAAFALERSPEQVFGYPEVELTADQLRHVRDLIARRVAREPLALITGEKEFWSLRFAVSPATLIPRPDSETVIEAVLDAFPEKGAPVKILDLGTGSGCLLLALLHEFGNARGIGTDISEAALQVARANAENLGYAERAKFILADWNRGRIDGGPFDLIVSNPPYVPEGDKATLQPEVALYEPHNALFAGIDGLPEFRTIIALLPALLNQGGRMFFEVGIDQAEAVADMMAEAGMTSIVIRQDIGGIGRCVTGTI